MPNTRTFTRTELDDLGLPDNSELAVIDHEVRTSRWVEHRVVVARIDGRLWKLPYRVGLTELQEDTDTWGDTDTVTAIEVELYDERITVTRYRPVDEQPAPVHSEAVHRFSVRKIADLLTSVGGDYHDGYDADVDAETVTDDTVEIKLTPYPAEDAEEDLERASTPLDSAAETFTVTIARKP